MGLIIFLLAIFAAGSASAAELREYGSGAPVVFALLTPDGKNFASVSCVAGDVKISKDGAAAVDGPCFVPIAGTSLYSIPMSAADLSGKDVAIEIKDSEPKLWLDELVSVETYGDPRARHPFGVEILPEPEPEPPPEVRTPVYFGTVNEVTFESTSSLFQARLSNAFKTQVTIIESGLSIFWINGPLAGRTYPVTSTSRAGTSSRVQFTMPEMLQAPGNGDYFIVW